MKREDFNDFYEKVILQYVNELMSFDKAYNCLTLNSGAQKLIYQFYEEKRVEIRMEYMADFKKPIDRHKTAASMMYAILRSDVFKIKKTVPCLPEPIRLANEYLAFYVGLNIIEQYKQRDELLSGKDVSEYQLIIPQTKYELQENEMTGKVENSFISSVCLTLANIKKIKYFDVFAYSTIFFLLEEYTDTVKKLKDFTG